MFDINTLKLITDCVGAERVLTDEPMSLHTSFHIGGNAAYYVMPSSEEEVVSLVGNLREQNINYIVVGNGSNLLVSDSGFEGVVVSIGKNMSHTSVEGNVITAGAGTLLSRIASVAAGHSLAGFEFASGIPGTLGGAVVMNAGAYGGEIRDVVTKTRYISADGSIKTVIGDDHGFGYRRSIFTSDDIILSAEITLNNGNPQDIRALMSELNARRKDKQPLDYPSAGSTFKRPEGYFAAKLIEDAGLKGYTIGGACVSEKHSGFVINKGNATAKDVMLLIEHIQNTVMDKFGVRLEPEVRFVGEF